MYKAYQAFDDMPLNYEEELPEYTYLAYDASENVYVIMPDVELALRDLESGELPDYQIVDDKFRGYCLNVSDHGNVSLIYMRYGEYESIWNS